MEQCSSIYCRFLPFPNERAYGTLIDICLKLKWPKRSGSTPICLSSDQINIDPLIPCVLNMCLYTGEHGLHVYTCLLFCFYYIGIDTLEDINRPYLLFLIM